MAKRRKIAQVVSNAKSVNQTESTVPTEKEIADKFSPTANNSVEIKNEPAKKPVDPIATLGDQGSALVSATKPAEKMKTIDTKKSEKVSLTIADQKASKPVDPSTTLGDKGKGVYDVSNEPAKKPVDPDTVLGNQGKALVTAISENPVAQVTQNEILNTGVKDASSPSELNQAVQIFVLPLYQLLHEYNIYHHDPS